MGKYGCRCYTVFQGTCRIVSTANLHFHISQIQTLYIHLWMLEMKQVLLYLLSPVISGVLTPLVMSVLTKCIGRAIWSDVIAHELSSVIWCTCCFIAPLLDNFFSGVMQCAICLFSDWAMIYIDVLEPFRGAESLFVESTILYPVIRGKHIWPHIIKRSHSQVSSAWSMAKKNPFYCIIYSVFGSIWTSFSYHLYCIIYIQRTLVALCCIFFGLIFS